MITTTDTLIDLLVIGLAKSERVQELVGPVALSEADGEAEEILEPMQGGRLGVWESRYGSVRQFAPKVLAAISFEANPSDDKLLSAVESLQQINQTRQRMLGEDTPTAFAPPRWKPLVFNDDVLASSPKQRAAASTKQTS